MNTANNETWGFLHPECHGPNAVLFFSWDLAQTIEQQFRLHLDAPLSTQLHEAQKAVDRLLNQYVQIQANPEAFEGQSITLRLEIDDDNPENPILALQTSSRLEELILEMQAQEQQASRTIN